MPDGITQEMQGDSRIEDSARSSGGNGPSKKKPVCRQLGRPRGYQEEMLRSCVRVLRWLWPGWWLYFWYIGRFLRHDCSENWVVCRCDWIIEFRPIGAWLDV